MTGKQAFWWTVVVIVLCLIIGLSVNAANKANAEALYHAGKAAGGTAAGDTTAAPVGAQCGGL